VTSNIQSRWCAGEGASRTIHASQSTKRDRHQAGSGQGKGKQTSTGTRVIPGKGGKQLREIINADQKAEAPKEWGRGVHSTRGAKEGEYTERSRAQDKGRGERGKMYMPVRFATEREINLRRRRGVGTLQ